MSQRSKREPILDDPETLKMIKELFRKQYPMMGLILEDIDPRGGTKARFMWRVFRAGFEAGYWADEIPLH